MNIKAKVANFHLRGRISFYPIIAGALRKMKLSIAVVVLLSIILTTTVRAECEVAENWCLKFFDNPLPTNGKTIVYWSNFRDDNAADKKHSTLWYEAQIITVGGVVRYGPLG